MQANLDLEELKVFIFSHFLECCLERKKDIYYTTEENKKKLVSKARVSELLSSLFFLFFPLELHLITRLGGSLKRRGVNKKKMQLHVKVQIKCMTKWEKVFLQTRLKRVQRKIVMGREY